MVWTLASATGNADHWLNSYVYTRTLSLLTQTKDAVLSNDMRSTDMCRLTRSCRQAIFIVRHTAVLKEHYLTFNSVTKRSITAYYMQFTIKKQTLLFYFEEIKLNGIGS